MKFKEFTQEIQQSYNKYFPHSRCFIELSKGFHYNIYLRCFLANNVEELASGYWNNDMFDIRFFITPPKGQFEKDFTVNSDLPEDLIIEFHSNSYVIKPPTNYLVYGRHKVFFRKTKGDSKKIIKTLEKFFLNLSNSLKDDLEKNNIHKNFINLVEEKIKSKT